MSVRKRTWTTAKGVEKEAWVVDYVDRSEGGQRRLKTFDKKKDATAFAAQASVEIRAGVHTADSASMTIAEAGKLWIQTGEAKGLERATLAAYRQHLDLHIKPYLGAVKLSQLSAPMVREFEDKLTKGAMPNGAVPEPRSAAMVRKIRVSLSSLISDAQERGLVARNVVRDLRSTRRRGHRTPCRASPERQAQGWRRHSDAGGNQGHRRGRARALAADPVDGDLYRAPRIRAARAALGGRRPCQGRIARAPARGSI